MLGSPLPASPQWATRSLLVAFGALLIVGCQPTETASGALFPDGWIYEAGQAPVTSSNGMVVSTDWYASEVGAAVLARGGNAVDAAIAVEFALAVVNPEAGNIGGGGFMVVRLADGETAALDFREKAPAAATRDMYLDADGNLTDRSIVGHLASGVPGTVSGMWAAHERYGTLPWAELIQPAIALAEGVTVTPRIHGSILNMEEALSGFAASAAAFLPGGSAPPLDSIWSQPDLARTLARVRDQGPDGFYRGETADLFVAEMERGGGIITHADLEAYSAAWREPVEFTYRGHTVISMPPSSSGGPTLAEIANIAEGYDFSALPWHGTDHIHFMVEAYRRAFADRNEYLADPDFVDMPLDRMTSKAYAEEQRSSIDPTRATPSSEVKPGLEPALRESENTTHFSIVDGDGNAVAVTTTLNSWYGSKVTVAGAGFVLNNEMDDFAAKPGTPNQFGLVQGENNAIEPGKRMLSAMTPTILLDPDGELFLVTGTPGGSTIITTVFQTISNVIDFGMSVADAVAAPRIHHQHLPDQVTVEHGGLGAEVLSELEQRGHSVRVREQGPPGVYFTGGLSGDVQAIRVHPDGSLEGFSDQRRGGAAVGYEPRFVR